MRKQRTTLDRLAGYSRLWWTLAPHLPAPSLQDAAHWAGYPIEAVEAAIIRASRRFAQDRITAGLTPQDVFRFVTATARHISQQQHGITSNTSEAA